ncbi:MAG: hypothetical protein Q4A28_01370 [Brachymonas sp.]|nr:hypothetical protein [Brachymonas sp.]
MDALTKQKKHPVLHPSFKARDREKNLKRTGIGGLSRLGRWLERPGESGGNPGLQ